MDGVAIGSAMVNIMGETAPSERAEVVGNYVRSLAEAATTRRRVRNLATIRGELMTAVRGIRGATTADADTRDAILDATEELLRELCSENEIDPADVASATFTVTPDLTAAFPAEVARVRLGWTHVALMTATEMAVPDAVQRCIRVLIHINSDKKQEEMKFVYLRDASNLRSRGIEPQGN